MQSVAVDTNGPLTDLPKSWTLGRIVSYKVTDNESGLASVRVAIKDEKEHFKQVTWHQTGVSGDSFSGEINWDGKFADGTVAPPGSYQVWVKSTDNAGNKGQALGMVTVPEPSIFNWFIPPSRTLTPTATATLQPAPTVTATTVPPTATAHVSAPAKPMIVVSSSSSGGIGNSQPKPNPVQPNLPLVSTAVAAMAAYAAYELERKREEELARQAAEEEHHAEMRAEARARAEVEWDRASAKKKAEQAHTSSVYAQLRAQAAEKERQSQVYAQLREQAAEKERQKAIDDFRKGEHAPEIVTIPQPKSWLEKAWDNTQNFVQEKIVQPFDKYVYQPIIKPVVEKATQTAQAIWNNSTTFVQEKVTPIIQKTLTPSTLLKGAITTTVVATAAVTLQCCSGKCGETSTPDVSALSTRAVQTVMAQFTQTVQAAFTPAPMATATPSFTADSLNSSVPLYQLAVYLYSTGVSECALDKQNSPECLAKLAEWQNKYNQTILDASNVSTNAWKQNNLANIDPVMLAVIYKRIVINETQFVPGTVTGSENGTGFAQVTPATLKTLVGAGFIAIPKGYNNDISLIALLQDTAFNAQAGMANLAYLYQGVKSSNAANGWQMSDEDTWKLVAALHNTGPQSNSLIVSIGNTFDFWKGVREKMQNDPEFYKIAQCNDPNNWDCLKAALRNYVPLTYEKDASGYVTDSQTGEYILDGGGKCSSEYAESVVPPNMVNDPVSSEVLNAPVRPKCETSVAPSH